jgi:hypothetical protein
MNVDFVGGAIDDRIILKFWLSASESAALWFSSRGLVCVGPFSFFDPFSIQKHVNRHDSSELFA